jgi:predicted RNase H-like HicB family nuclease
MRTPAAKDNSEEVKLLLTLLTRQDGADYTGLCLQLDIASCGKTADEAIESPKGLVELYVQDYIEDGEVPIPLRPVPLDALQEFLRPSPPSDRLTFTARQQPYVPHAYA